MCQITNQQTVNNSTELMTEFHFPTPIYVIEKPEFLSSVSTVSEESLSKRRQERPLDEVYPLYMSDNLFGDPRVEGFANFVGETAWNILNNQGYFMDNIEVFFTEMWTQEHHKHSLMEQHVHGGGAQIVGFYFLEVPDNTPPAIFYDPRTTKVMVDLLERDPSQATIASRMINFRPKPGLMIFTNSWLAHSFGRNPSDQPFKFVHFNINARQSQHACQMSEVEIV